MSRDEDEKPDRDDNGRFLPGNRFWEARSTHGRNPIFPDAEALRAACIEYFEWVSDNPLGEEKLFSYEGGIVRGDFAKMQAMTIKGLCIFLDISYQGWTEYREKTGFSEVCGWVENVIYHQKFTGAAAGMLNPAIIARDLGLADKSEVSGPNGEPIQVATTDRDRAKAVLELMRRAKNDQPSGE